MRARRGSRESLRQMRLHVLKAKQSSYGRDAGVFKSGTIGRCLVRVAFRIRQ